MNDLEAFEEKKRFQSSEAWLKQLFLVEIYVEICRDSKVNTLTILKLLRFLDQPLSCRQTPGLKAMKLENDRRQLQEARAVSIRTEISSKT